MEKSHLQMNMMENKMKLTQRGKKKKSWRAKKLRITNEGKNMKCTIQQNLRNISIFFCIWLFGESASR